MFLYSKWRALDLSTRIRLANDLGIKKFGPTHVRDNVVESDGYLIQDVENALSLESLGKYIDIPKDKILNPDEIWDMMLNKVNGIEPLKTKPTKHAKKRK